MGKTIQVRVDESLVNVFGLIGKSFAEKVKKEYNLEELFVSHGLASQILAAKFKGVKSLNFKVRKTGFKSGVLELD